MPNVDAAQLAWEAWRTLPKRSQRLDRGVGVLPCEGAVALVGDPARAAVALHGSRQGAHVEPVFRDVGSPAARDESVLRCPWRTQQNPPELPEPPE